MSHKPLFSKSFYPDPSDRQEDEALEDSFSPQAHKSGSAFNKLGSGYSSTSKFFISLFNILLASFFLIAGSPLLLSLALIIKIRNDGPILYSGTRLGLNKQTFTMYKFRTLPVGTQSLLGSSLFTDQLIKLPFFVKFLRETRLDELPQLINIFKGDMDFIGPRPLRPEVYTSCCRHIQGFDRRFSVRPGLIGYSQLFTPHSSPKRIRSIIDNRALRFKRSFFWDIYMIAMTLLYVFKKFIDLIGKYSWNYLLRSKLMQVYKEKRLLERIPVSHTRIYIYRNLSDSPVQFFLSGLIIDINDQYLRFESRIQLDTHHFFCRIERRFYTLQKTKRKTVHCYGCLYRERTSLNRKDVYQYVVQITPRSPFYAYMLDQYILNKSMIRHI